jgi:ElaB/YqjD/DUF883 family membrane-anchored ribosome-binding protein
MEWNENAGTPSPHAPVNAGAATGPQNTIDEAMDKARQAAGDAQQKISSELRSRAESTRGRAADALDSVAQALSRSGQQLRAEDQTMPGDYLDRFGDQIRRASDYLRNTSTDDLVRRAEDLARRQPAVFVGGAFALGFLAARLIRSSQAGRPDGGSIPGERSLVPDSWTGDREASVSGFREPGTGSTVEPDTDISYTRAFGREAL